MGLLGSFFMINKPNEDELDLAIGIAEREGVVSISLLQRRMRVGYTRANSLMCALAENGVLGARNPHGLHLLHSSRLQPMDSGATPETVHTRLIHDLAWYALETHQYENTDCVQILSEGVAHRDAIRAVVASVVGTGPRHALLPEVALAIARMPTFNARVPTQAIELGLMAACEASDVRESRPNTSEEVRLRGMFFACRYLKRRLMEGMAPHSRVVEHFVHVDHLPQGAAVLIVDQGHHEHVVPCVFAVRKASELLLSGLAEQAVAEWIEPYVRVVRINKADADELDTRLRLKTAMPPNWEFGRDCMYARLHELEIAFEAPKDGPWCNCGVRREKQTQPAHD